MIFFLEGVVTDLTDEGFTVRHETGQLIVVASPLRPSTYTPVGDRHTLAVGDRVRVSGGPGDGGVFLCSTVRRRPPEPPRRSWWRLWG